MSLAVDVGERELRRGLADLRPGIAHLLGVLLLVLVAVVVALWSAPSSCLCVSAVWQDRRPSPRPARRRCRRSRDRTDSEHTGEQSHRFHPDILSRRAAGLVDSFVGRAARSVRSCLRFTETLFRWERFPLHTSGVTRCCTEPDADQTRTSVGTGWPSARGLAPGFLVLEPQPAGRGLTRGNRSFIVTPPLIREKDQLRHPRLGSVRAIATL